MQANDTYTLYLAQAVKKRTTHWTDPSQQIAAVKWLGRDQHVSRLLSTAQQLLELQHDVAAGLPASLRPACQALKLDDGQLTLGVRSASISAKLRQCAPSLARHLSDRGWQVERIQVRVQANVLHAPTRSPTPNYQPQLISPTGLAAFEALAETLPEGAMNDAIRRLIARRRSDPS